MSQAEVYYPFSEELGEMLRAPVISEDEVHEQFIVPTDRRLQRHELGSVFRMDDDNSGLEHLTAEQVGRALVTMAVSYVQIPAGSTRKVPFESRIERVEQWKWRMQGMSDAQIAAASGLKPNIIANRRAHMQDTLLYRYRQLSHLMLVVEGPEFRTASTPKPMPKLALLSPDMVPCQKDPELFFSKNPFDEAAAKALCMSCVKRIACQKEALENEDAKGTWGGMTEAERRKARKLKRLPVVQ